MIQPTGNAVFDAPGTAAQVSEKLAAGLEKLTGAQVEVMIRTHAELGRIIAENPFVAEAAADGARVHVVFLAGLAAEGAKEGLDRIVAKYPARRDRFHVAGATVYLHLPDGAGESKLTGRAMDSALGVPGTARNWNTVLKLGELAHGLERDA